MLTYVYYEDEPGRRSAAKLFSKDEFLAHHGEHREAAGTRVRASVQVSPLLDYFRT